MDRSGGVSNGYYGDNSGGSGGGDSPQQPKDDFEDYMWMANEEEAEKEMLKQIEDEQIYSELLEEEERLTGGPGAYDQPWQAGQQMGWSTSGPPPMGAPQQSHHQQPHQRQQQQQQPWSTCPPGGQQPGDALARDIGSLSVNDRPKVALNPMAAEFVPGQSFQPASG